MLLLFHTRIARPGPLPGLQPPAQPSRPRRLTSSAFSIEINPLPSTRFMWISCKFHWSCSMRLEPTKWSAASGQRQNGPLNRCKNVQWLKAPKEKGRVNVPWRSMTSWPLSHIPPMCGTRANNRNAATDCIAGRFSSNKRPYLETRQSFWVAGTHRVGPLVPRLPVPSATVRGWLDTSYVDSLTTNGHLLLKRKRPTVWNLMLYDSGTVQSCYLPVFGTVNLVPAKEDRPIFIETGAAVTVNILRLFAILEHFGTVSSDCNDWKPLSTHLYWR